MDEFLEVFGDLKVATVITVLVAIFFIWKLYKTARKQLIEKYKKEEAKEKQVQEIIDQAANYPKWHQQSLDIQQKFSDAIAAIEASQNNNLELLNHLGRMLAENEATTCRYRILRFNDEILHDQRHTKEHFDQILDDVTRYEKFCKDHPEYENNKAILAIENIKRVYKNCTDVGTFL